MIGGHDPLDSTSIDQPLPSLVDAARQGAGGDLSGVRIGVVKELGGEGYQPGVLARFQESLDLLVKAGAEVVEVSAPSFVHALAAYYLILPAEASSNLAKFDAMRYGLRVLPEHIDNPSAEDVMRATRDAGFGDEVKRRIILGTYALSSGYYDAYYGQAREVHADQPRLRGGVRAGRRARRRPRRPRRSGWGRSSTTRWRCTSTTWRPSPPTWPCPGHLGAQRPRRRGRPPAGFQILAPALADDRLYRVGAALEAALAEQWGGPLLDQAPELEDLRTDRDPGGLGRSPRQVRPGAGPRGPRRAEHELEDVLRLPDGVRRRPEHAGLPDLPQAPRRCRWSTSRPWSPRSGSARAQHRHRRLVPLRPEELLLPDMPKNFQTSQYDEPIAFNGYLDVEVDGEPFRVEIERAHGGGHRSRCTSAPPADPRRRLLAGRLQPGRHPALIEIVTKPIMGTREKAPEIAKAYVAQLREPDRRARRLRRADGPGLDPRRREPVARPAGEGGLGTRTETKNVNLAVRRAGRALRDAAPGQRTPRRAAHRAGDAALARGHQVTTSGREKSDAEDYRYFPEPDLVPVPIARVGRGASSTLRAAAREAEPAAGEGGASPTSRCATPSVPVRWAWSRTPSPRAQPRSARKWWLSEMARRASDSGVEIADLGVTP